MSIKIEHLNYVYSEGTAYEKHALKDICLEIPHGEFVGIIGHTGSGKSTLIQHLNGLIKGTSGAIYYNGENIYQDGYDMRALRSQVGMVFQYPEHQLFEETVFDDVAFGPRNLGLSVDEVQERVETALTCVGLNFSEIAKRSPFRLSGGQMRRVAIAGVIALQPEYLVLDEPSAGLDPCGRDEIYAQILQLYRNTGMAVVLVTHNMEDVARMAKRLLVMDHGRIRFDGPPVDLFHDETIQLQDFGVSLPHVTSLLKTLRTHGLDLDDTLQDEELVAEAIRAAINRKRDSSC